MYQVNTPLLHTEFSDHILTITFNRLDKKNALTIEMYQGLVDLLKSSASDNNCRVLILRGATNCFTAGHDIKDFLSSDFSDTHPVIEFLTTVANFEKPLIAAIAGPAVGIGTTILLHCDLVYAAEHTYLQMPFINLGLCPEAGSSLLLPLHLGHRVAAELLMLGKPFDVEKAMNIGLVNEVVSESELFATALSNARDLSLKSLPALIATKALLKKPWLEQMNNVIADELVHFKQLLNSDAAKLNFANFLNKGKS